MECTSKTTFIGSVLGGFSRRYWRLYAYGWCLQALGMTLLSLLGYYHCFSKLYEVTCGRMSILLWGAVPGLVTSVLCIPCLKRWHKERTGACVAVATVAVLLWLLGGYVKTYSWMSERFYLEESTGIYHLIENCDCARRGLIEVKGIKIEREGYQLCSHCEEMAEDMEFIPARH